MSVEGILNTLDKAHTGPVCSVKEWNTRVIPGMTQQKLKDHRLIKTCDPANPINTDDELADEFYKAGFELAIEMGVLCQETERIVKVTEDELIEGIRNAPSELVLGYGEDRVVLRQRKPEDKIKPLMTAPTAVMFSEEMYVTFTQAVAQYREIDVIEGASLVTIFGRPVLAGTPYETLLGRYEAQLKKEALWRAGRPGMPTLGVSSSPTEYGQFGGFGTVGGLDPSFNLSMILVPGEMMTHFPALHKIAHTINCGGKISMGLDHMIGGYSGPPEGAAVTEIANWLLQYPLHQAHAHNGAAIDVRYFGMCGREGQWTHSIATQALSRNTHLLGMYMQHQVSGPGTDMLLYEGAVTMMQLSASGAAGGFGSRSSGSKYPEHLTPLECKFCAEILKDSAGMTRKEVNEIVKVLIPKYEDMLKSPPKGKSFTELYDLKTLKPKDEWNDIYLRVKRELIDLGVPVRYP